MYTRSLVFTLLGIVGIVVGGCAQSGAWVTRRAPEGIPQPDRVVVYDFAVSPYHVQLVISATLERWTPFAPFCSRC